MQTSPSKITNNAPKTSVGQIGDYAVVFQTVGENAAYTTANDLQESITSHQVMVELQAVPLLLLQVNGY
jgi:hypothetical protein